jgi:hypothetical protein
MALIGLRIDLYSSTSRGTEWLQSQNSRQKRERERERDKKQHIGSPYLIEIDIVQLVCEAK